MVKELKSVKNMYGVTLGFLITLFVAFGITAFYHPPYSYYYYGSGDYARNILLIASACGLIFSVVGLLLPTKLGVFRLGLLLSGFLTMIYAISYPTGVGLDLEWAFGAVGIALVVLIPLGCWKLVSRDGSAE